MARSRGSAAVSVLANELSKLRLAHHDLEALKKKTKSDEEKKSAKINVEHNAKR